jgi:hypothetical protein
MVRDLTHASGSIDTLRGEVGCAWSRQDGGVRVEAVVPVGSEADVVIPGFKLRHVRVTEGGRTLWENGAYVPGVPGVAAAAGKDGAVRVKVGSGRYAFVLEGD